MDFVLDHIPLFLMAGLLAFILIAPLIPGQMPKHHDVHDDRD